MRRRLVQRQPCKDFTGDLHAGGRAEGCGAASAWVRLKSRPRGLKVYADLVDSRAPGLGAGDRVALLDREGRLFAWGLYHPRSAIAVRLVRRGAEPFDTAWFQERAAAALARRREDGALWRQQALRVLHAEGDDFPGLAVDRYGEILSAEAYTSCALRVFEAVRPVLHTALGTRHDQIVYGEKAARAEREKPRTRRSEGCPAAVKIEEHGVRFEVRLDGHKTGFFCDQRGNRRRLQALADGREVLDVCSYTGGFALAAWKGGAAEVTGVDLDEKAVAQAQRNAHLNSARVRFVHADAFSYLRTLGQNLRQFGLVVLDPPKWISGRHERDEGIARYHDLNKLALRLVRPGGWLLSCSCSGLLPVEDFIDAVRRAARGLQRTVRVVRVTGAGPDHPVRLDAPEGAYLKALWLRVDGA